jgi:hypothetical protein
MKHDVLLSAEYSSIEQNEGEGRIVLRCEASFEDKCLCLNCDILYLV